MDSHSCTIYFKDYHCIPLLLYQRSTDYIYNEFLSGVSIVFRWIYLSILLPVLHSLDYYNFIVSHNVSRNIPSTEFYERETKLGHLKLRINPKLLSVEMQYQERICKKNSFIVGVHSNYPEISEHLLIQILHDAT